MKPFRFTLEAVRILRQRQEHDAMEEYARAQLARQQALERLETVQKEQSAAWQHLRHELETGCPADHAHQSLAFQRVLQRRQTECLTAVGAAERRLNAAMQAMLNARQQREIVDKFHAKQKAGHQRELAVDEQKMLDDLAGRRAGSMHSWNTAEAT